MAHYDGRANLVPLTTESARKIGSLGGKASAEARKKRKSVAEALRQVLDEPLGEGANTTRLDAITAKVIHKMFDDPDIRDIKVLAEILGEVKQSIETSGLQLNISTSQQGESNINKILDGE